MLYYFAVSFYILEISNNNAFLQGLYLALCGIAMLVFTPVGGVLGDRFNKGKIMYLCDHLKGGLLTGFFGQRHCDPAEQKREGIMRMLMTNVQKKALNLERSEANIFLDTVINRAIIFSVRI